MRALTLLTLPILLMGASQWANQIDSAGHSERAVEDHHHHHEHSIAGDYRSPGKPGTAVANLIQSHFKSDSLRPQSISLELQSGLSDGELLVEIVADEGLSLTGVDSPIRLSLDQRQSLPAIDMQASAAAMGRYYVHVVVTHQIDGEPVQARALAAEVQFGVDQPVNLYAKSAAKANSNFVVLPAVETIR